MSIAKRIKEIRKLEGLSQEEFASRINLSRSIIGCYENNIRNVGDRTIKDICEKFNINEEWLRFGTGEMNLIPPEIHELTNVLSDISLSDNQQLKDIVAKLSILDEKYLTLIDNLIDALLEKK